MQSISKPRLTRVAAKAALNPRRSPLFHWMAANHARLEHGLSRKGVDWKPVIAAAVAEGISDGSGGTPTQDTMWRTWRAVCSALATATASIQENGAATSGRKRYRRDLQVDARPVPLAVSATAGFPVLASATPPASSVSHKLRLKADEEGKVLGRTVTHGRYLPEPDYTGMTPAEASNARQKWLSLKNR